MVEEMTVWRQYSQKYSEIGGFLQKMHFSLFRDVASQETEETGTK